MATDNPTDDSRLVPLDLPEAQARLLRRDLANWATDLRADLREPDRLENPDRTRAEAAAYERLLAAVEGSELRVPDAEAERVLRSAAAAHDSESEYERVVAEHDAMHALLAAFDGER